MFGNQITLLPDSIGNITTLETLYFSNNQITLIPSTFSNLTNLRSLNI
ncbi:leucine-rich repeat domain-containing protein [Candidatus Peregrinibacteria bacterium]|nr:leucine-rich repeat domain-containing protein [Candidatus Peregrinibacteria bacterium]MCB9804304.1 leucine-rich repeat domain-containing protein [Candidatus Peribacteria bacterium]MCB9805118.1 leucine-rich repeat domain-containing protein [Candidatus Peribacteria bacterium]